MKRQSSELMEQNPWNIVQFKVIVSIIIILKDKTSKYRLNKVHLNSQWKLCKIIVFRVYILLWI